MVLHLRPHLLLTPGYGRGVEDVYTYGPVNLPVGVPRRRTLGRVQMFRPRVGPDPDHGR